MTRQTPSFYPVNNDDFYFGDLLKQQLCVELETNEMTCVEGSVIGMVLTHRKPAELGYHFMF